jgi:hypothetical protein
MEEEIVSDRIELTAEQAHEILLENNRLKLQNMPQKQQISESLENQSTK